MFESRWGHHYGETCPGHLNPLLEHLNTNRTRVACVAGKHFSKELWEQLTCLLLGTFTGYYFHKQSFLNVTLFSNGSGAGSADKKVLCHREDCRDPDNFDWLARISVRGLNPCVFSYALFLLLTPYLIRRTWFWIPDGTKLGALTKGKGQ